MPPASPQGLWPCFALVGSEHMACPPKVQRGDKSLPCSPIFCTTRSPQLDIFLWVIDLHRDFFLLSSRCIENMHSMLPMCRSGRISEQELPHPARGLPRHVVLFALRALLLCKVMLINSGKQASQLTSSPLFSLPNRLAGCRRCTQRVFWLFQF